MRVIPWDPFRQLNELREEMGRLWEQTWSMRPWDRGYYGPRTDIYQTEKEVVVTAELPGIESPDDVEITVDEDSITIRGEIKRSREVEDRNYFHQERFYGSYVRTLPLPVSVKAEEAKASYRNGILEIRIPKAEQQRRKTIRVDIH